MEQIRTQTAAWPANARPVLTARSLKRVTANTLAIYAQRAIEFVRFANQQGLWQSIADLEVALQLYLPQLADRYLRPFTSCLKFFFPFLDRTRVLADLRGQEQTNPSEPTTPVSRRMMLAIAFFLWAFLGVAEAIGVVVMFETMLRTCEALKIRAVDVIFRGMGVHRTIIRLGKSKNGREQYVELEPDSLGERMLRFLVRHSPDRQAPLFEFRSYARLYAALKEFCRQYRVTLELTPHSFRAGGATARRLMGQDMPRIQADGRWESLSTCRGYVDVVFSLMPETLDQDRRVAAYALGDFAGIII